MGGMGDGAAGNRWVKPIHLRRRLISLSALTEISRRRGV